MFHTLLSQMINTAFEIIKIKNRISHKKFMLLYTIFDIIGSILVRKVSTNIDNIKIT